MSKSTADLLVANGKGHWMEKRAEQLYAKGKGVVETYWLSKVTGQSSESGGSSMGSSGTPSAKKEKAYDDSISRLIDWNVSTLGELLKKVVSSRPMSSTGKRSSVDAMDFVHQPDVSFLDEVAEIVPVSSAGSKTSTQDEDVELSVTIQDQLRHYIATIAGMYHDNAFHSFQHASHVL